MPSAIVGRQSTDTGWPTPSDSGHAATLFGLHTDDAYVGPVCPHCCGDPGNQSATAHGDDDGGDLGHLLEDLQPDRPLAGHDVGMVERVDEHRAGFRSECLSALEGDPEVGAAQADIGTVGAGRTLLGDRGALRA
jgi:hypothetical protein